MAIWPSILFYMPTIKIKKAIPWCALSNEVALQHLNAMQNKIKYRRWFCYSVLSIAVCRWCIIEVFSAFFNYWWFYLKMYLASLIVKKIIFDNNFHIYKNCCFNRPCMKYNLLSQYFFILKISWMILNKNVQFWYWTM